MNKKEASNKIDARTSNANKYIGKKRFYALTKWEAKCDNLLLKSWFFIVLVAMLGAGAVLGTVMYLNYGVGAFNEIFVVQMLDEGLSAGEWSAVTAFAVGFLIARVLEAPLVGILDIGGAILTGVGVGIPAVFLATEQTNALMHNPWFGLLIGGIMGGAIGGFIILIRVFAKKGLQMNLGTDIMMGAGNQTGAFLGPLVMITAAMVNPIVGIGSAIGATIFYMMNKPIIGGAILGAMLLGIIPAYL